MKKQDNSGKPLSVPSSEKSGMRSDTKAAWNEQSKWEGSGKGTAERYGSDKINTSEYSVEKGKAYEKQAKAPTGRGMYPSSRGSVSEYTKESGDYDWDDAVEKASAYKEQCKWGDSEETPSMGFNPKDSGYSYMPHFQNEAYLRAGHNTAQSSMMPQMSPETTDSSAGGPMGMGPKMNVKGPSLAKNYAGMKSKVRSKFKR